MKKYYLKKLLMESIGMEAAKKSYSLNGRAIKKKKKNLEPSFPTFQRPLSSVGGVDLNGPAIKRRTFLCGYPNSLNL